jgi:hypothetical protein
MEINISQILQDLANYTNGINILNRQFTQIETDYIDNKKKIFKSYINLLFIDPIHAKATKNLNNNAILINDYMFKILEWFVGEDVGYTFVNIKSININNNNDITYFSVYASNTELGIWRLLARNPLNEENGYFYKGDSDYVQQTMIDIYLQLFIIKEIKIITVTGDPSYIYIDNIYMTSLDCIMKGRSIDSIKHIDDKSRKLIVEPFKSYNDNQDNSCSKNNSKITLLDIQSRLDILSAMIETDSNFNIIKSTKIGDFQLKPYPILSMYNVIFKNDIVLYYFTFNITNWKPDNEKKYYSPLILTNNKSKITNYGTYSHYILAGNYICKPFMGNQAAIDERSITINFKGTSASYLIANRYTNLYPYNMFT